WGRECFDADGNADRKVLAQKVFSSETELKKLTALLYPALFDRMEKEIADARSKNEHLLCEVPLLFECGTEKYFDKTAVIWCSRESASHVALECALETQPNICLISEEVAEKKMSLSQIADYIADSVEARSAKGMNFGVAIIPEGVVEFVPEFSTLIAEINELLAGSKAGEFNALPTWDDKYSFIEKGLTKASMAVFAILPQGIQQQLFLERDPHGNVQVSLIESEKLFSALVADKLAARKKEGKYNGKFSALHHFLGYEGRCAFPSNFDADYCYSLGYNAFMLIQYGYNGYLSKISNLSKPATEWVAGGMPITKMMNIERRHGEDKPVIKKALVELDGKPFKEYAAHRDEWAINTDYLYPGAIQYYGPAEVCDQPTKTLKLERN
ncbi:MAG: dephospho-CoA kinase, partial [Treponema sp.]|nr:dephospho-CoA kinase [Treponema sp.]